MSDQLEPAPPSHAPAIEPAPPVADPQPANIIFLREVHAGADQPVAVELQEVAVAMHRSILGTEPEEYTPQ